MSSTRRCASACDDTSIAQAPHPRLTISRSICWTSTDSGVVLVAGRSSSPTRYTIVPSMPHLMAAASKSALTR
jgi:hypothetical protein